MTDDTLHNLFISFDSGSKIADYRELCATLVIMGEELSASEKLSYLFGLYDSTNSGYYYSTLVYAH